MRHVCLLWSMVALASAFSANAAAQDTEGRFQLALTTPLVQHMSQTLSNEDSDEDIDISTTAWGIGHGVGFELGYGIGEMIVLGAVVELYGGSRTIDADTADSEREVSEFNVGLGPKIDVLFSPGSSVRPFVGAVVALAHASDDNDGGAETTQTGFELHGRLGLHVFATEGLSLSPSVDISYGSISGEVSTPAQDIELSTSTFAVMLLFGINGWL